MTEKSEPVIVIYSSGHVEILPDEFTVGWLIEHLNNLNQVVANIKVGNKEED